MASTDRNPPPNPEPEPNPDPVPREQSGSGSGSGLVARRRRGWRMFGRYARALGPPLVLWALLLVTLREPMRTWLRGENTYDKDALQEWLEEARAGNRETLPELIDAYLALARRRTELLNWPAPSDP